MNDLVKKPNEIVAILTDQHPADLLADMLEETPDRLFKMDSWFAKTDELGLDSISPEGEIDHSCGTTGCIAGWAIMTQGYSDRDFMDTNEVIAKAREILGLSSKQANRLFYDFSLNKQDAIFALRHFAETGELPFNIKNRMRF